MYQLIIWPSLFHSTITLPSLPLFFSYSHTNSTIHLPIHANQHSHDSSSFFYPYRIRKDITFLPASLKLACPTTVAAQQHSPQKEIPFFKEIFYLFCPPARSPIAWRRWSRLMSLTILVKLLTYVRNYYNTNVPHQCNTIQYKNAIILILVSMSDTLNTECHF